LGDAESIQVGQSTLIRKNPPIPSLPACNWGQRPVLERILPLRRWRQSCLEGDSLRFSGDKISRVRIPYRTKVIRLRIGLDRNQKSSRRLLEGSGKGKSQVKLKI
jgi:hypothetical protein